MQLERTEIQQEKEVESLKTNGLCQKCYENICKIVLINHYSPVKGQKTWQLPTETLQTRKSLLIVASMYLHGTKNEVFH